MQQVQAISPRASRVLQPVSTPLHESFKDAKGTWLNVVVVGLLLLCGASALAVWGVRHDVGDAPLKRLKTGFVAGPGGPKLSILSELLRTPETMPWALGSLAAYACGVLAVMWPERVGIMGIAGIGRLLACLMAVAALLFGACLAHGEPDFRRIFKLEYDEMMTWLIFLDMAAMILVNMRIAGIAGRGGYHGLAKLSGGMMAVQVSGVLLLLFTLNVPHKGMGLLWASAGANAAGGIGVGLVGLFLVLTIWWEMLRRGISKTRAKERTAADDWDDPSK